MGKTSWKDRRRVRVNRNTCSVKSMLRVHNISPKVLIALLHKDSRIFGRSRGTEFISDLGASWSAAR